MAGQTSVDGGEHLKKKTGYNQPMYGYIYIYKYKYIYFMILNLCTWYWIYQNWYLNIFDLDFWHHCSTIIYVAKHVIIKYVYIYIHYICFWKEWKKYIYIYNGYAGYTHAFKYWWTVSWKKTTTSPPSPTNKKTWNANTQTLATILVASISRCLRQIKGAFKTPRCQVRDFWSKQAAD